MIDENLDQTTEGQDPAGEPQVSQEAPDAAIKYYYNPKRNTRSESYMGVPLTDLTEAQVASYPRWIQESLAACKFYQAEPPDKED